MYHLRTLRKSIHYSNSEIKGMLIGVVCMAFILSFNDWGVEEFSLVVGISNFMFAVLIVGFSVFFRDAVQRLFALRLGIKTKFRLWWYGILVALIFTILVHGAIKLFLIGGITMAIIRTRRLGRFYYRSSLRTASIVSFIGPLTNIGLAALAKFVSLIIPINGYFLERFVLFNVAYAVLALLPIPPLEGSHMFYHSRLVYSFIFGSVLGYMIFVGFSFAWLWALLFGVGFFIVFYKFIERPKH